MKLMNSKPFRMITICIFLVILAVTLCACDRKSSDTVLPEASDGPSMPDITDGPNETAADVTEPTDPEGETELTGDEFIKSEPFVPTQSLVLEMRAKVEEGMTGAEITRLTECIKVANVMLEQAYFYDDIFMRLAAPESLYWNYFEATGEIQIGWAEDPDGTRHEVIAHNHYDAQRFISLMGELKDSVRSGLLDEDFDRLIYLCSKARETHEVTYVEELYHMLHDMDYFLLRYGISDVGPYVADASTISKYYGSLSIWSM